MTAVGLLPGAAANRDWLSVIWRIVMEGYIVIPFVLWELYWVLFRSIPFLKYISIPLSVTVAGCVPVNVRLPALIVKSMK